MELAFQGGDGQVKQPKSSSPRPDTLFDHLQELKWKLRFARDKFEDVILDAQIPERIKKHLTFYRLHTAYFLLLTVVGTLILFLSHRSDAGERRFSLVDSLFNTVSVVTVTGLTTVKIADFSGFDRIFLLVLMTLGSPVFTSLLPLYVRRFYFYTHQRRYVKELLREIKYFDGQKQDSRRPSATTYPGPDEEGDRHGSLQALPNKPIFFGSPDHSIDYKGSFAGHESQQQASMDTQRFSLTMEIVNAFKPKSKSDIFDRKKRQGQSFADEGTIEEEDRKFAMKLSWLRAWHAPSPVNIMKTMEHRGLVALCWVVPAYILVTQVAGFLVFVLIFLATPRAVDILKDRNLSPGFFSFFTTVSAFTNSGIPAHDDNMVPFQTQYSILLLFTVISLMGNLLFPSCIRLVIWILHAAASEARKPVYSYLLEHPRRCFTHLFPYKQSVWLCLVVFGITVFQLVLFCTLDWRSQALVGLDATSKVIDGVFQSVSARNAGGAVVAINLLSPSMLVLYLFMMFMAAYPVALLRQNSTVYEHADMAIYDVWEEKLTSDNSLTFQSRKLLAKDSVYLCVILFAICVIESKKIDDDPLNFSIFNIIFEVVSAYGGVGMSVGYSCSLRLSQIGPCTDVPYSFSGKWTPTGRIILVIAMIMGRHRGLPDDIDSAIKLPSFHDIPLSPSAQSLPGLAGESKSPGTVTEATSTPK